MYMVEEFYLIIVFKIKKNKFKGFFFFNLMKIIEYVMLFSYLREKSFLKDMLKYLILDFL